MLHPETKCPECENPKLSKKELYQAFDNELLCAEHDKVAEIVLWSGTDKDA